MGIRNIFGNLMSGSREKHVSWRIDPYEGLDFVFERKVFENPDKKAIEDPFFGLQFAYLKGLHEQGYAEKNANGYTIASAYVADLEDDFFDLFELPPLFNGHFNTRITGSTGQSAFKVSIGLELADGTEISHYTLFGPFLKLAEDEYYRLTPAQWRAFSALQHHQDMPAAERGEYENNWLIFQLQIAKKAGMKLDLSHFNNLEIVQPEKIGVAVEQLQNGDLTLTPTYGAGLDLGDIQRRLGQVRDGDKSTILRVRDKFVLLDDARLEATREILTNRRIPKDQVAVFLKSPTAYLNAALIDLDTGFSLRAHGAERFSHRYFGDIEQSGIDWFAVEAMILESIEALDNIVDSPEQLQDITSRIDDANANGATGVEFEGREFDLSDQEKVARTLEKIKQKVESRPEKSTVDEADQEEPDLNRGTESAVVAIDSNDEAEDFVRSGQLNGFDKNGQQFSLDTVKRSPFPHQQEGIQWLLAHYENAMGIPGGSGALLADDMGLGKTYMILVSVAEWYRRVKAQNKPLKPVLIVAPLSLIENWQAEVEQTFHKSPFTDIVVLQSGADLKKFRIAGGKKETQQDFKESDIIEDQDEIRYSLKVGGVYGIDRLDTGGRLVLTTYQTLRDYQFSLSRIDWSIVAFDEAQNLKNPNTLATRAAKAVKSDVKILATGTPVENSLKDFWCLMDTAVPGLLGAWQTFRSKYIEPITSATEDTVRSIKADVGRSLREAVGEYMLRRTKEERLDGLPEKRIFSGDADAKNATYLPDLAALMRGAQLNHYDDIINAIRHSTAEDKRKLVLPGLLKMKLTSIHQDIESKLPLPHSLKELERQALSSAKITAMMSLLKSIQQRREKVLIFATSKAVQAYVCALVSSVFKIKIDIINGETQAVATGRNLATRKGIIDEFQKGEGFGVIVMSPIAAGVGLTVTGANNVIHLERHWNPAKEAQATDRVYRIGQKRNVNVYIPIALHPKIRSFDLQLDSLLSNKVDLSDAVVAASQVEASDLMGCFSD